MIRCVYVMYCTKHDVYNRISLKIHCSPLQNYTMLQETYTSSLPRLKLYLYHEVADLKAATVPQIAMRVETISIVASIGVTFR